MKNIFLIFFAFTLFMSCKNANQQDTSTTLTTSEVIKNPIMKVAYPDTRRENVTNDFFGTTIADPYRWLEIDTAAEVSSWVKEQNKSTFGYLENIPYRDAIKERYEELFNYPKLSSPFRAGEYYFFYKNNGLQNQSVIYYQKGLDGEPSVFMDPNKLSDDGTVTVSLMGFDNDYKYVAYSRQEAGSDWQEIHVKEIATMKDLNDVTKWVKFSGASWWKDGYFYSRYPEPAKGTELSADFKNHAVYYHKLGTPQSADKLAFDSKTNPNFYHYGGVTEDKKYNIVYQSPGTDGFATYYQDLEKGGEYVELFKGYSNKSSVVHNIGATFLVLTDIDAPNYRLVEVDIKSPAKENWKDIIPESKNLLGGVNTGGGKLFASYLEKATTRIYEMDYDGGNKKELKLPGVGSASSPGGKKGHDILFYTFTSFIYPPTIFKYNVKTGESEIFNETELKFNPADYEEKQIFYTSKDGTKVSMFIVHKKGLKLDGNNPAYLYGYGGFNISLTPSFSTSRIILLENGGVFALANLRGGGEYGEEWHQAGMLDKKQNVFDDFIAAGEYLIKDGYTTSEKLAINGGSNGGLLVGAVMTQRPDLFAVAIPAVGVMDMLRFQKFTAGKGWTVEYGNADNSKEEFDMLHAYSPVHNIKDGVKYPATMVMTADHDDRVVPAHSFKFASQLQKSHAGDNPVLIRIAVDAGHGAGKPTSKIIEEEADRWAFVFWNTNSPVKYLKK
ncbi:MAG: prolyl oligopeptidase [Paraglaciecola sp.]|jgi:prolyl oligopeptidase